MLNPSIYTIKPFVFDVKKSRRIRITSFKGLVERQTKLQEFTFNQVRFVYIPINKKYKTNVGLSERILKKRLERQGWTVWRGGSMGITRRNDIYPNVRKKYEKLTSLLRNNFPEHSEKLQYLSSVHHGVPDFFCHRNGAFKFVECKLGHESLSSRQKKCIQRLQSMGFLVEVHKLVFNCTKNRIANINLDTGEKTIVEKQMMIRNF